MLEGSYHTIIGYDDEGFPKYIEPVIGFKFQYKSFIINDAWVTRLVSNNTKQERERMGNEYIVCYQDKNCPCGNVYVKSEKTPLEIKYDFNIFQPKDSKPFYKVWDKEGNSYLAFFSNGYGKPHFYCFHRVFDAWKYERVDDDKVNVTHWAPL